MCFYVWLKREGMTDMLLSGDVSSHPPFGKFLISIQISVVPSPTLPPHPHHYEPLQMSWCLTNLEPHLDHQSLCLMLGERTRWVCWACGSFPLAAGVVYGMCWWRSALGVAEMREHPSTCRKPGFKHSGQHTCLLGSLSHRAPWLYDTISRET